MSSTNHVKNVAIVGATGTVGAHIVTALLAGGQHTITALTRHDSAAIIPPGVKTAPIDYTSHASLVSALRGQDVLIITLSVTAPPETQTQLIDAAADAGVPFVLPNEWGPDVADEHGAGGDVRLGLAAGAARRRVEERGVSAWVGVVTGFWYEFSLAVNSWAFGLDWKAREWTFYDEGETKISVVTLPQSGKAVAGLLSLPLESSTGPSLSQYKNKFVYISSFTISQKDMFESVLRVSGTTAADWKIQHEVSEERFADGQRELQEGNRAGFGKLLYARFFFKDGSGNHEASKGLDNEKIGLVREDLDEFTRLGLQNAERGLTYN